MYFSPLMTCHTVHPPARYRVLGSAHSDHVRTASPLLLHTHPRTQTHTYTSIVSALPIHITDSGGSERGKEGEVGQRPCSPHPNCTSYVICICVHLESGAWCECVYYKTMSEFSHMSRTVIRRSYKVHIPYFFLFLQIVSCVYFLKSDAHTTNLCSSDLHY